MGPLIEEVITNIQKYVQNLFFFHSLKFWWIMLMYMVTSFVNWVAHTEQPCKGTNADSKLCVCVLNYFSLIEVNGIFTKIVRKNHLTYRCL